MKTTKQKKYRNGGDMIGKGTFGCVVKPPIRCKNNTFSYPDGYTISKIFKTTGEAQKELMEMQKIDEIDPNYVFHLEKYGTCQYDIHEQDELIKGCEDFNEIGEALFMEEGGIEIHNCTFNTDFEIIDFFFNLTRIFIGLIEFKNNNLMHNDIKHNNILFRKGTNNHFGKMSYIDFGITKSIEQLKKNNIETTSTVLYKHPIEPLLYKKPFIHFFTNWMDELDIYRKNLYNFDDEETTSNSKIDEILSCFVARSTCNNKTDIYGNEPYMFLLSIIFSLENSEQIFKIQNGEILTNKSLVQSNIEKWKDKLRNFIVNVLELLKSKSDEYESKGVTGNNKMDKMYNDLMPVFFERMDIFGVGWVVALILTTNKNKLDKFNGFENEIYDDLSKIILNMLSFEFSQKNKNAVQLFREYINFVEKEILPVARENYNVEIPSWYEDYKKQYYHESKLNTQVSLSSRRNSNSLSSRRDSNLFAKRKSSKKLSTRRNSKSTPKEIGLFRRAIQTVKNMFDKKK